MYHDCNPSSWEVKAEGSQVQSQIGLHRGFQASLCYTVKVCLKKKKTEQNIILKNKTTNLNEPIIIRLYTALKFFSYSITN